MFAAFIPIELHQVKLTYVRADQTGATAALSANDANSLAPGMFTTSQNALHSMQPPGSVAVIRLGVEVMASGEAITLNFAGSHLAVITAEPSAIRAPAENRGAVLAPGGRIILSAKALDRLQGAVVRNTSTLEATGLSRRIVLAASDSVENSVAINANAGADGSLADSIAITALVIVNSGTYVSCGA